MRIEGLYWDDENIEHIIEHGVFPTEVEDVCFGPHIAYPARYGRYELCGQTRNGKYIRVILRRLYNNRFEIRTAYEMTDSQKKNYKKKIK
jgi:hypothetical protein